MKSPNPISGFIVGLGLVSSLHTGIASADVTTEQKVSVQGVGIMAVANMSGTTRTAISGNKSRTDSDLQLESKIVRFFARNTLGPTIQIVNLDADRVINANVNKKEYTEQTFEEFRARMQKILEGKGGAASAEQRSQPSAIDESKCEWLDPKSDVRKTGEKGTFAGFEAERVVISAEQPCKDKQTGAICEIALTLDEWMAPKFASNEEALKYRKAYAQKIGLQAELSQDSTDRAKAMFSRYKGAWEKILEKMKDVKGYPLKSSFGLALGGDTCKDSKAAAPSQSANADDSSSSGASGSSGASPADIAGKVGAKLGSLFHKKKDDAPPADQNTQTAAATPAPAPVTGPSGTITLMTITSELVSVSTTRVAPDAFDVPVGYKKVEAKSST